MEQELERLEGTVEDIIYLNEDNGYTVFEVSGGGVVTVVCGVVGELHAGESVVCRGRYENHATYGRQFHAQECETDMPKDLEAVYAFLASRSLPYIGARTADKIIDKFGAAALEVIANDPAQLTLIPGISADKADRIQQEFKRMFGMRELIAYLAQFEISPRRAMEVFRTFGFAPLETPAMENLSTLLGKYGEEGDKLLFKILNSGDYADTADAADGNGRQSVTQYAQYAANSRGWDLADSDGYGTPSPEAVEWLKRVQRELGRRNGDGQAVPAIAFQHIPPQEFYDCLREVPAYTPKDRKSVV